MLIELDKCHHNKQINIYLKSWFLYAIYVVDDCNSILEDDIKTLQYFTRLFKVSVSKNRKIDMRTIPKIIMSQTI